MPFLNGVPHLHKVQAKYTSALCTWAFVGNYDKGYVVAPSLDCHWGRRKGSLAKYRWWRLIMERSL